MIIDWIRASQGQNLARRVIALSITFTWLSIIVAALFGAVEKEAVDRAFEAANAMDGPVMLILAFYFAAPHLGSVVKGIKRNGDS